MSSELAQLWESAGGQIPPNAEVVAFEALLAGPKSIAVGVMYPGEHCDEGVPLIKVGDIKGGRITEEPTFKVSQEVNTEHKRTQLCGDELLITLVGEPGCCVVATPAMRGWNPARAIAVARLKEPSLRTYVKAILESRPGKHLIDSVLNTTVQKTLNLKDVRKLPVPLPPRDVIDAVSQMVASLEDRIALLRETNATLEAIAQALFKSWFIDFEPVRAKMAGQVPEGMDEATAALFPDALVDSELGLVPDRWTPVRLDSFLELSYGKALKAEQRRPGPVPVYGSGGITGWHDTALVLQPSVIVGRKGTVGSLYWESRPFFPIDTVFYAKSKLPLTYCFELLKTLGLSEMNTDAAVPGLNRENAYRLLVPGASVSVIHAFDAIVSGVRMRIDHNAEQAQTIAALRDTLLPRLISGRLNINEIAA